MKQRTQILILVALAIVIFTTLGLAYAAQVAAQSNSPTSYNLPKRWEYATKFVCGESRATAAVAPPSEPDVNPGIYTTKINIHNPNAVSVTLMKKVVLDYPEGGKPITPTPRVKDTLRPDFAMSVNCAEIVKLLGTTLPANATYIEGYLVVDALGVASTAATFPELDVDAVYTTAQPAAGSVNNIQVNHEPGRILPAGTWPF